LEEFAHGTFPHDRAKGHYFRFQEPAGLMSFHFVEFATADPDVLDKAVRQMALFQ